METLKLSDPQFTRKIEEMVNAIYSMPEPKNKRPTINIYCSLETMKIYQKIFGESFGKIK